MMFSEHVEYFSAHAIRNIRRTVSIVRTAHDTHNKKINQNQEYKNRDKDTVRVRISIWITLHIFDVLQACLWVFGVCLDGAWGMFWGCFGDVLTHYFKYIKR